MFLILQARRCFIGSSHLTQPSIILAVVNTESFTAEAPSKRLEHNCQIRNVWKHYKTAEAELPSNRCGLVTQIWVKIGSDNDAITWTNGVLSLDM